MGGQPPVILPLTTKDKLRLAPEQDLSLPVRIYNPRGVVMEAVRVMLASEYPTAHILSGDATIPRIEAGGAVDVSARMGVRFTAGSGYFAPTGLLTTRGYAGRHSVSSKVSALVIRVYCQRRR